MDTSRQGIPPRRLMAPAAATTSGYGGMDYAAAKQ
jgi:hypothetical protein